MWEGPTLLQAATNGYHFITVTMSHILVSNAMCVEEVGYSAFSLLLCPSLTTELEYLAVFHVYRRACGRLCGNGGALLTILVCGTIVEAGQCVYRLSSTFVVCLCLCLLLRGRSPSGEALMWWPCIGKKKVCMLCLICHLLYGMCVSDVYIESDGCVYGSCGMCIWGMLRADDGRLSLPLWPLFCPQDRPASLMSVDEADCIYEEYIRLYYMVWPLGIECIEKWLMCQTSMSRRSSCGLCLLWIWSVEVWYNTNSANNMLSHVCLCFWDLILYL